ncbi:MAG: 50S ribosomal protein L7/L12 [uncultured bacterium]|nr:MAG: 50S ribosomal protein L7/L12 [uncultured bacterium]
MAENELDAISERGVEDLRKLVALTHSNLEKISRILDNIDKEKRKEMYKEMPGVSGYFDGTYLIGEDGSKYEVPANYAAKSRIVFGDTLKMIEEDGKKLFKQIDKVPRKRLEGILSKKEGKWYFLSDGGTYKVSDIAAEFHKAELNDKAVAYVPENALNATYAALDYLEKEKLPEVTQDQKKKEVPVTATLKKADSEIKVKIAETKKSEARSVQKPVERKIVSPVKPKPTVKPEVKPESKPAPEPPKTQKEFVANIMDDDDLR